VNVARNILTLLTFVEAIGKMDPLGEEDGPARSSQVLSPDHPENNQTRIVSADQYHMNVFLIYPHQKKGNHLIFNHYELGGMWTS